MWRCSRRTPTTLGDARRPCRPKHLWQPVYEDKRWRQYTKIKAAVYEVEQPYTKVNSDAGRSGSSWRCSRRTPTTLEDGRRSCDRLRGGRGTTKANDAQGTHPELYTQGTPTLSHKSKGHLSRVIYQRDTYPEPYIKGIPTQSLISKGHLPRVMCSSRR